MVIELVLVLGRGALAVHLGQLPQLLEHGLGDGRISLVHILPDRQRVGPKELRLNPLYKVLHASRILVNSRPKKDERDEETNREDADKGHDAFALLERQLGLLD